LLAVTPQVPDGFANVGHRSEPGGGTVKLLVKLAYRFRL